MNKCEKCNQECRNYVIVETESGVSSCEHMMKSLDPWNTNPDPDKHYLIPPTRIKVCKSCADNLINEYEGAHGTMYLLS